MKTLRPSVVNVLPKVDHLVSGRNRLATFWLGFGSKAFCQHLGRAEVWEVWWGTLLETALWGPALKKLGWPFHPERVHEWVSLWGPPTFGYSPHETCVWSLEPEPLCGPGHYWGAIQPTFKCQMIEASGKAVRAFLPSWNGSKCD